MLPIIKLLRPKQWIKNVFVLAPLAFSLQFTSVTALKSALLAMLVFIMLSSCIYCLNDLLDLEADRAHPKKSKRPIASGQVSPLQALFLASGLLLGAIALMSLYLPRPCLGVGIGYGIINLGYSIGLKKHAIVDVCIIAIGFVLRVLMGGYAIQVKLSPWIILTTFLLALFIGFGKRYHEFTTQLESTKRKSLLKGYNKPLLDKLISITCTAAFISYAIYTVEMAQLRDRVELVYTIIFVIFGLFRYLKLIDVKNKGEEPETLIYDKVLFINAGLWLLTTLCLLS